MYSQWVTSPLLLDCLPQNAFNAEKSYEALLSHVITELSMVKTVYDVNTEEPSMVSHIKFCKKILNHFKAAKLPVLG